MHPMPKELVAKLEAAAVNKVVLAFSGGHDEGHLSVSIDDNHYDHELIGEVHDWADNAYEYGGAGDGVEYGDNYTYDLVRKIVSHDEWCYEPRSWMNGSVSFDELDDFSELEK